MTLHPVRVSGMVINAPQSVDYLKQMQERVVRFVCAHSGLQKEAFYSMLEAREDMANDVGTILDGEAAVRCGLIDQIGGLGDALDACCAPCSKGGTRTQRRALNRGKGVGALLGAPLDLLSAHPGVKWRGMNDFALN